MEKALLWQVYVRPSWIIVSLVDIDRNVMKHNSISIIWKEERNPQKLSQTEREKYMFLTHQFYVTLVANQ